MPTIRIRYPTPFLRNRRIALGLTQLQVAESMGIEKNAYMKLEQRGEIPEKHLCSLSRVLKVSTTDLLVEKYAPVMRHIFHIPTEIFRTFVKDHMSEDRAFGKKFPTLEKLSVGVLTSDHV